MINDTQLLIRLPRAAIDRLDLLAVRRSRAAGITIRRATLARALLVEAIERAIRKETAR